ncbi:hypothetical protein [Kineosporia mesophila]|nr:hypothetical protein [Kineosporia mesophila]
MTSSVPVLDLGVWYEGAPTERGAPARRLDEALGSVGLLDAVTVG